MADTDMTAAMALVSAGFERTIWWRVVTPMGRIRAETGNEREARRILSEHAGDVLQRLWKRTETRWLPAEIE